MYANPTCRKRSSTLMMDMYIASTRNSNVSKKVIKIDMMGGRPSIVESIANGFRMKRGGPQASTWYMGMKRILMDINGY